MKVEPALLITRKTGDWWQDDRRNWCAYCGCGLARQSGSGAAGGRASRDHVMPRAHKGRHITIPACVECNGAKKNLGLPEFMLTAYFAKVRERNRPNQWTLRDLWLVTALAAVEQARLHGD